MFNSQSPLTFRTPVLPPCAVRPSRGVNLAIGDILRFRPGGRFQILHIEQADALRMSGVWLNLNAPLSIPEWKRRGRFEMHQIGWYSVELSEVHDAR